MCGHEEQPNMLLDLTATIAAHSVLRPLCLLRMSAAQQRVGGRAVRSSARLRRSIRTIISVMSVMYRSTLEATRDRALETRMIAVKMRLCDHQQGRTVRAAGA
jgi:hypothetical protein